MYNSETPGITEYIKTQRKGTFGLMIGKTSISNVYFKERQSHPTTELSSDSRNMQACTMGCTAADSACRPSSRSWRRLGVTAGDCLGTCPGKWNGLMWLKGSSELGLALTALKSTVLLRPNPRFDLSCSPRGLQWRGRFHLLPCLS